MTERARADKQRGEFGRSGIRRVPRARRSTAAILFGCVTFPGSVFASGAWETSTTQVKVGTLPLLAALGIGIAVAVGAVIAFLQMTAKGRTGREALAGATEEQLSDEEQPLPEWNEEEAAAEALEEHTLTDYTIPVTQILPVPEEAEPAEGKEPRLCGLEGEHAGMSYRIANRRLTFGRDPSRCAILFPYEAGEISRIHCTLKYMEENRLFILEDNGSSNGTFLSNGERLKPGIRYELRSGERFSLSGKQHWFEVRDEGQQVV